MNVVTAELFRSYDEVVARRESEMEMIKEKLARDEKVDTPVCKVERVSAASAVLRFGLKRGKLLYLFKYPDHDVEREKHRNVITRARFIKASLENAGYTLIPWDFKKAQPPTFWEGEQGEQQEEGGQQRVHPDRQTDDRTMEEEDDDLYGPPETVGTENQPVKKEEQAEDGDTDGDQPMDEGLESGEEEDESSDESDLEIIIDKPQTAPAAKPSIQPQESKAIKIEAPPQTSTSVTPSTQPKTQATQPAQQLLNQDGRNYPAQRTSTIDVNADPVYPPLNKPISQIDFDSDFAESQMPWRVPGADPSDYFNYGFDEFTWVLYQGKQQSMTQAREQVTNEVQELQQMFGGGPSGPGAPATTGAGGGGPGVPGAPTGPAAATGGAVQPPMGPAANMPPAMPGMPPMTEENMQMMMAQMQANGMDMTNMDFNSFMQMASGMFPGGAGGPGGAQAGFGQGQGGHGQGGAVRGGRRGRGW